MTAPVVLGVDPGLANFGYAFVELHSNHEVVLRCGVIRTEKSSKKRAVRASDDNVRRVRELLVALPITRVHAVCAESMSFPRAAGAAHKLGLAWGALVARVDRTPIVQASPQEIKQAVTGKKIATKEEVQEALSERYGVSIPALFGTHKTQREHAADALAAVVACLDSEVIRAIRER